MRLRRPRLWDPFPATKCQHHADVGEHQRPAIFRRHDDRFAGRLSFGLCCFDLGSFRMYAAASLSDTIGRPFGGLIRSSCTMARAKAAVSLK
jgi:hypothetical protein